MSEAPELSVVVPVYDEGPAVLEGLREIERVVAGLGLSYEMVVVDDGSGKQTRSALESFAGRPSADCPAEDRQRGAVLLLRLSRNFGKEAAICAGLAASRGEGVVLLDADLQHPPELIPAMVERWRDGYEVVEAVKARRGRESWIERLGSSIFYRTFAALGGPSLVGASDFKLLARPVVERWRELEESETFFRGLVAWLGFRHAEIPFSVPPRHRGRPRWSRLGRARLALFALSSFSSLPLHFVTVAGLFLLVASGVLGLQALAQKWRGEAVEGFTTVIVLNGMIGSTIMISLGIIGLYLARIYNEVKRRPRYVVAERIESEPPSAS